MVDLRNPDEQERNAERSYPRLLLIDMTPLGGVSATGALKNVYLDEWPTESLLQVSEDSPGALSVGSNFTPLSKKSWNWADAELVCRKFQPELILYRPVSDRLILHAFAQSIITDLAVPHVVWMMDDWPERLRVENYERFRVIDRDLRILLSSASHNFAISEKMADVFATRYETKFSVARNGVSLEDWIKNANSKRDEVVVRYAGSLAPDTTKASIEKAAKAISILAAKEAKIRLEIKTQPHWYYLYNAEFTKFQNVSIEVSDALPADYRAWLMEADILLVAYNFDQATKRYLKYSFANKTPEVLASGVASLVFGPAEIETVNYFAALGVGTCVLRDDIEELQAALTSLANDPQKRRQLGEKARAVAFREFDLTTAKKSFVRSLRDVVGQHTKNVWALKGSSIDECLFVHSILKADRQCGLMLDVGAHTGGSLAPFARDNWRVYAFEPDPANRRVLSKEAASQSDVLIFNSALGSEVKDNAVLYTSRLSSGISGLHSFHDSHVPTTTTRVVTIDKVIESEVITQIDFLKIDVEGGEMAVLDGFDIESLPPRAIVVEFDNAKTRALGYDAHDLAKRLAIHGYTIFVSEWRPIQDYGGNHEWRRLRRYPCMIPENSWGNFIAVRENPTDEEIHTALQSSTYKAKTTHEHRSYFKKMVHHVMENHPLQAEFLRFSKWTLERLWGSLWRVPLFVAVVSVGALAGAMYSHLPAMFWLGLLGVGLWAASIYLLLRYNLERLEDIETRRLDSLNELRNELKRSRKT